MKEYGYREVMTAYYIMIEVHRREMERLEKCCQDELTRLRERCIKEHGSHLDDGGFMMGFCKRCGECLG